MLGVSGVVTPFSHPLFLMLQITFIFHQLTYYAFIYSFKLMKMYKEMHYLLEIFKKRRTAMHMGTYSPVQGKQQPVRECESH